MKIALFFLIVIPMGLLAQEKGTHFEHGLSWAQVKEKAKAERKYILMDCYTTWCGPCKYLRDSIFPREEVGNALNDKFICVGVQIDSTKNDDENVRAWYADARTIARDYKVNGYPTIYVFSPDGELAHRVRSMGSIPMFIQGCIEALDPKRQQYTILRMVQRGELKDTAILRDHAVAAADRHDEDAAFLLGTAYLDMQQDLLTDNSLRVIGLTINHSTSKYFPLLLQNTARIDKMLGPGFSADRIRKIIIKEEISPKTNGPASPDWDRIVAGARAKFPAYGEEAVAWFKPQYYIRRGAWVDFSTALRAYMIKYSDRITDNFLQSYATTVFIYCPDPNVNKEAVEWAKKVVTHEGRDSDSMILYASLLYKTGKTAEAIRWGEKAAGMENAPFAVKETLERMKRGEKIWNN